MDFTIPKELQEIAQTVREFVDERLEPIAYQVESEDKIPDSIIKEMGELGIFGLPFPAEYGGIEAGELGSVRLIYYRLNDTIFVPTEMLSWAARSTVQWFIGSHSLDTVTWLIADKVESVYAVSRSVVLKGMGVDTPDFYEVILEFANGAVAVVENCWILPNSLPNIIDLKCEIVGSEGALYVDGSSHRVLERHVGGKGCYPDVLVMPEIRGKQMGFAAESIRHFIDCVADDKQPSVTGEDGLRVTELIEAVERSAASGAKVSL